MGTVTIRFPRPADVLSMNDRKHWAVRSRQTREWRTLTALIAGAADVGELGPSVVRVTVPFTRGARRDPHNYFATVKPVIDGLVDAGLWPDDTPEWVTTVEPQLVVDRDLEVVIEITPRS